MVTATERIDGLFWRVALFSAVALLFQVILTRLFSVAQFYHFVFLIISIAMLGYAVSGVVLAFRPPVRPQSAITLLMGCALAGTASIMAAYLILNHLPFDSFSIAWDVRQLALFALNYFVLSVPFFCSGLALGALLNAFPHQTGKIYAWNFIGAGVGCLGGLALPGMVGGEGVILACCILLALCGLPSLRECRPSRSAIPLQKTAWLRLAFVLLWSGFCTLELVARSQGKPQLSALDLRLSPYKSLSYALQVPDAVPTFQRWNAFSRVDVIQSRGIRSVPGLSFNYSAQLPPQAGLFIDGDNLSPLLRPDADLGFTAYLPQSAAFLLQPGAQALILEPRGGMDILVALHQGASEVVAVEVNPLVIEAAQLVYTQPKVTVYTEDQRSFTRRTAQRFDVILLTLTSSFHPVRSGAYSLAEDYRYTVESLRELIGILQADGILVFNRWLQRPPSESLRAFATVVEALEGLNLDPQPRVVVLRGYALATFFVKRGTFTEAELFTLRQFASSRAFDFIYAPDLREEETNRYNVLAESLYTPTYQTVLDPRTRRDFYQNYAYEVRPATDDHPFFAHYFKWSQTRQTIAEFGQSWQPFGGAGMLVVVGLLGFVVVLGGALVGLTAALLRHPLFSRSAGLWQAKPSHVEQNSVTSIGVKREKLDLLAGIYFTLIGFAYLLVEIALIQRFQLYLAQPAYAVAGVLFAVLVSSGMGSLNAQRIPLRLSLPLLSVWIITSTWWLKGLFEVTLALPLVWRMVLMAIIITPGGFGMGVAFPGGLRFWLREAAHRQWLPLIWSLNGAASVVASVGAMFLALSFGFTAVLQLGALLYGAAWIMVWAKERRSGLPLR